MESGFFAVPPTTHAAATTTTSTFFPHFCPYVDLFVKVGEGGWGGVWR